MANAKRVAPSPPAPMPAAAVPLDDVMIQRVRPDGQLVVDGGTGKPFPVIPGVRVAALLELGRRLWGEDLARLVDYADAENRANDLAGLADRLLVASAESASACGSDAELGALAVLCDGLHELAARVRAVAGRTDTYHVVAEEVR